MTKQNHTVVIEHDNNSRSNLIRLRMRHGSAGYGIYHLLLEYLLTEPDHTAETDYGDFTRHLISTLRIRLAHMKQTAATMPICQESANDRERQRQECRREWAERERKAVTYEQYLAMKEKGLVTTERIAG